MHKFNLNFYLEREIPNICPKVVNSVVKGDLWAFEVPLPYKGDL